jgi:hypothetical protein
MESSETWLRTEFRSTAYNSSYLVNWGKNQKDGLKDTKTAQSRILLEKLSLRNSRNSLPLWKLKVHNHVPKSLPHTVCYFEPDESRPYPTLIFYDPLQHCHSIYIKLPKWSLPCTVFCLKVWIDWIRSTWNIVKMFNIFLYEWIILYTQVTLPCPPLFLTPNWGYTLYKLIF